MSDDRAVLIDVANAVRSVLGFVADRSKSEFDSDMLLQSAVLHQLLVLGEAVRRLTAEFRAAHPEIDWRGYAGLRNVLIHQYDNVDLDEVWRIVVDELPTLKRWVAPLLPDDLS
jgi:uncharacterized protein with HEPN domain